MAAKSVSNKKSGSTRRRVDAGDKDRLISELKDRVAALEKELRSKRDNDNSEDVAERKEAETALRDALLEASRFRMATENVPTYIYMKDLQSRYIYANKMTLELFGCSAEEIVGSDDASFFPWETVKRLREIDRRVFAGEQTCEEIDVPDVGSGRRVYLEIKTPIYSDLEGKEVSGLMGISTDITERKRIEEALRSSQSMLQSVMGNVPLGIFWKDRSSTYLGCNEVFAKAVGLSSTEEIVGKTDYDLPWLPKEADSFRDYDRRIMENDAAEYHIVEQQREADRKVSWVETNKVPLHDAQGNVIGILGTYQDITERKRAEEALRESEEKFKAIFDRAALGLAISDSTGLIIDCNSSYEEMLGYGKEELMEMGYLEFTHPDDVGKNRDFQRQMNEGLIDSYQIEKRYIRKDGQVIWCNVVASAIRSPDGKLKYNMAVIEDITERKWAEEALRESEGKYRGLVEQVNDWVWEIDANGVYTYASPRVCELLGYEPGEVVGATPFDYMAPDEAGRVKALFAPLLSEPREFLLLENTLVKKEGGTVKVETSGVPIYDDQHNFSGYRGIDRDITERKRAEEALSFERSQLLSIFDSIDDVVYVTDPYTYEVLYANKAMKEKFGGDLVGGVCYREFQKRDSPCDFCTNSIILKDKGKPYRWEYYNPTVDRYFMITDRIIRWPDGRDVRFEIAKDITERKRAEEALRDAKQQAELYLDLMGHDINNMHQIALGYLELAQGVPPGVQLDEMIGKSVDVLQRSTQLIRNVRKLQKLNEDFGQMHEVDVGGMLYAVRREFRAVPGKSVTLNFNAEMHCFVRANELLHDVFANLVGNAIKHTGDKADINIDLDIVNDNTGKYCRVSVEDNGPGIPDNFKDVIFNRLLKGTNKSKGMGLGLYLVKSLVDSYGGRVWVEDRVPEDHTKGARFVVMLPAVDS